MVSFLSDRLRTLPFINDRKSFITHKLTSLKRQDLIGIPFKISLE